MMEDPLQLTKSLTEMTDEELSEWHRKHTELLFSHSTMVSHMRAPQAAKESKGEKRVQRDISEYI